MFSNHACCCLFQMFASNMHQNEWFQVRFFKIFLGRGSPSPLPRPLPRFRSGLRPRARASPSILGRFAPSIVKLGHIPLFRHFRRLCSNVIYVSHEIFPAPSWKPIAPYAQFPSYGPASLDHILPTHPPIYLPAYSTQLINTCIHTPHQGRHAKKLVGQA